MALKYRIDDQQEFYFVTFTAVKWVDVFTRNTYREIVDGDNKLADITGI